MKKCILVILLVIQLSVQKLHKHHKSHKKSLRNLRTNEQIPEDSILFMAYDENGELHRNIVKKSEMNVPKVDECNFAKKREYPFCTTLNECELCVRAPRCGWCSKQQKCIATACERDCPSVQGHPSLKHICGYDPKTIYSGTFSKITEESTKTVNPEIARPKVAITTVKTTMGTTTFQKQVGQQSLEEKLSLKNFAGQDNYNTHKITVQPQFSNTTFTFPVKTLWNKEYYDMITGQSLAQEKVLHGEQSKKKKLRK